MTRVIKLFFDFVIERCTPRPDDTCAFDLRSNDDLLRKIMPETLRMVHMKSRHCTFGPCNDSLCLILSLISCRPLSTAIFTGSVSFVDDAAGNSGTADGIEVNSGDNGASANCNKKKMEVDWACQQNTTDIHFKSSHALDPAGNDQKRHGEGPWRER